MRQQDQCPGTNGVVDVERMGPAARPAEGASKGSGKCKACRGWVSMRRLKNGEWKINRHTPRRSISVYGW